MLRYPFVHPLVFVAANYKVVGEEAPTIPLSVSIEGFSKVRETIFFRDVLIDNLLERLDLRATLLERHITPCIEIVKERQTHEAHNAHRSPCVKFDPQS